MPSLTPRQLRAVSLLAQGKSQRQAARDVGVTAQTLCAWVKLPEFETQLQNLMGQSQAETLMMLRGQRIKALETINHLMDTAPAATRLQAARTILEATNTLPPPLAPAPAPTAHDQLREALAYAHNLLVAEGHLPKDDHALRH